MFLERGKGKKKENLTTSFSYLSTKMYFSLGRRILWTSLEISFPSNDPLKDMDLFNECLLILIKKRS